MWNMLSNPFWRITEKKLYFVKGERIGNVVAYKDLGILVHKEGPEVIRKACCMLAFNTREFENQRRCLTAIISG